MSLGRRQKPSGRSETNATKPGVCRSSKNKSSNSKGNGKAVNDRNGPSSALKFDRGYFTRSLTKIAIAVMVIFLSIFLSSQEKDVVGSRDSLSQRRIGYPQTLYHCEDIPPCSTTNNKKGHLISYRKRKRRPCTPTCKASSN